MKYIDLSYNINSEMPVYPGDMKLTSNKEKDCDKDGFNLYSFSTTMHIGTHIDAPLHMCKNKKSISLRISIYCCRGNVRLCLLESNSG